MKTAVGNPSNIKNNPAPYKDTIYKIAEHLEGDVNAMGIILRDGKDKLAQRSLDTKQKAIYARMFVSSPIHTFIQKVKGKGIR